LVALGEVVAASIVGADVLGDGDAAGELHAAANASRTTSRVVVFIMWVSLCFSGGTA